MPWDIKKTSMASLNEGEKLWGFVKMAGMDKRNANLVLSGVIEIWVT